jgi:hypothetical protein
MKMNAFRNLSGGIVLILMCSGPAFAQTFTSGSTGALGAFAPDCNPKPCAAPLVVLPPDGVLHYTTVTIPAQVTVKYQPNAANTPVTLLATGDVTIGGTISVDGQNGEAPKPTTSAGGVGGPGGFRGGNGSGVNGSIPAAAGQGPGGGANAPLAFNAPGSAGTYGATGNFISLIPLFGGSGGGGAFTGTSSGIPTFSGPGGGGGGGALVIASSSKITFASTGVISANGGAGASNLFGSCAGGGGAGSGGAVRLVAPQILGNGSLAALTLGSNCIPTQATGRIRMEAFTNTFTGNSNPAPSLALAPGPVTATSNPALINVPSLVISSIGGVAVPAVPTGSYSTADIPLPAGTTNPVPIVLTATNTPLNTILTMKLIPIAGDPSLFPVSALSGLPSLSTATANVTFPSGQVSVLNAYASLTITAGLFPLIDGEEVDRVLMTAAMGGTSSLTLVTKSSKEVPVSQLSQDDQLKVALAFEAMRTGAN